MCKTQTKSNRPAIPATATIPRDKKKSRISQQNRHGMTLIETIAAAALLMVALGMAMKIIAGSSRAEQAAQRKALATEILSSLLEEKIATPITELTPQEAAKWKVPDEADILLPEAKLETEVTSLAGPPAGKKITLKLTWQNTRGQRTTPIVLSAWVFPRAAEEMSQ